MDRLNALAWFVIVPTMLTETHSSNQVSVLSIVVQASRVNTGCCKKNDGMHNVLVSSVSYIRISHLLGVFNFFFFFFFFWLIAAHSNYRYVLVAVTIIIYKTLEHSQAI